MFTYYKIFHFLSFLFFIVSFVLLLKVLLLTYFPDFTGYYFGAKHILTGGNPYVLDSHYFTTQSYPPLTLLFFIPFSFLSLEVASKVWVMLSLIFLLYVLLMLCKMYRTSIFSPTNLFLCSLIFFSFPVALCLCQGLLPVVVFPYCFSATERSPAFVFLNT